MRPQSYKLIEKKGFEFLDGVKIVALVGFLSLAIATVFNYI